MTTRIKASMKHLHYPFNFVDEWDNNWRPERLALLPDSLAFVGIVIGIGCIGLLFAAWPA